MLICINYKQKPSTTFQNCKQPLLFTSLQSKEMWQTPKKNIQTKLLDLQWMKPWNWEKEKKESQCYTTWKINLIHLLMFWISHLFAIASNNKTTKATTKPLQTRTQIQTIVALKHTNCSNNNHYQNLLPPSNGLQTNKKTPEHNKHNPKTSPNPTNSKTPL
jgi:hypothetical protein